MSQKKFTDFDFGKERDFEFNQYRPEVIAAAIEHLGCQHAEANSDYERAKDYAEFVLAKLCVRFKNDKGCSATAAKAEAEMDQVYQEALVDVRKTEEAKIKAQSSFKAADAYSRLIITKVASEARLGEYYKKGNLT